MAAGPEMRLPYGPGWEDPDWTPHVPPATADAAADERPRVSTLAQFMAVLQRAAAPGMSRPGLHVEPIERRRPVAGTAAYVGQTRRWVIAGGAGLLAISTIPALPRQRKAEPGTSAPEAAQGPDDARHKDRPPRG
jgi:hypothetical protein